MKKYWANFENWWFVNDMRTFVGIVLLAAVIWGIPVASAIYVLHHFIVKYW